MISLGFMTLNTESERSYFHEIGKRAKKHNITCYRFMPSNINPLTEKITGEIFDEAENKWTPCEFTLPSFLYDRCFYGIDAHSKQCLAIVDWLKKRADVTFLGYGLPNKIELYHVLSNSRLGPYLPKTHQVLSAQHILETLNSTDPLIIKPVNGSQGVGIYYLHKLGNTYEIKTDKRDKQIVHTFHNDKKLLNWLSKLLQNSPYLMQPYLPLTNKKGKPFDIRTLLQKNHLGEWTQVGRGIRVGESSGIVSNLSFGAKVIPFESWLETTPRSTKQYICDELQDICSSLPSILEQDFFPLFELGVDIGLATDGSLWILDVNSKPGRKVILQTTPDLTEFLYESPLLYAKHLANRDIPERRTSNHEKILSD